ncbi:MAG: hypothetical protein LH478_05415 [Chitinophagaceae bacterium]|nr:hypothetical protein [Chitinophagaceae bacterium]
MKLIKHLAVLLAGIVIMASCQKEYSIETGSAGGRATGTLKDSLGDCQPITLRGIYFVDSTLTDSNYVILQVNVTVPGSYTITTDLQNGYGFRDTGFFLAPGLTRIKLKAVGRPTLPVTSDFTVTFGNSFCIFSVPAISGITAPAAVYTLSGTANNCTNAVVQGTYTLGTALNASNTVSIQVNVTQVGTYVISTSQTNGMIFLGNGTFNATGIQSVTLRGSGTPVKVGANAIPVTAGGTTCAFTVNVVGGSINFADSAWQFTQGSKVFHGTIDSVAFSKLNGIDVLQLYGLTYNTGDSLFVLGIGMTSSNIQSGTYNTSTFAAFNFSDVKDSTIYQANPTTISPLVNLSIVLNYDAATKIAQGTFTGTAQNAAKASVPITLGKFKAVLP